MIQRREHLRFTLKTGQTFRIAGEDLRQDLDRHVAAELRIPGTIHLPHAAGAEGRLDFVWPNPCSGRKAHPLTPGKVGFILLRRILSIKAKQSNWTAKSGPLDTSESQSLYNSWQTEVRRSSVRRIRRFWTSGLYGSNPWTPICLAI